jgi:hypothetical protein
MMLKEGKRIWTGSVLVRESLESPKVVVAIFRRDSYRLVDLEVREVKFEHHRYAAISRIMDL